MEIQVYSEEKDVAELIQKNRIVSHVVELSEVAPFNICEKLEANIKASPERTNFDLHYIQSVLVSSVVNENLDYFSPAELWGARNTAKDKPFNVEHECDDIIGHMTSSYVIDGEGNKLDDNLAVDQLPDTLHIIAQAVLYKHWSKDEKQARMNTILAELKEQKWFVSVECLFSNFDYIIINEGGPNKLIARNDKTSFLTKYLRVYGGAGVYQGQKIGRVPRNFILSGKGLVREPANKSSIIFAKKYEIAKSNLQKVYQIQEEVNQMDNDKELQYKDTIKKLEADLFQLKASDVEAKVKDVTSKLEVATKTLEANVQEITALKASIQTLDSDKVVLAKTVDELQAQKKEIETKLLTIEKEKQDAERVNLCKAKLGMNDEEAVKFSVSLSALDNKNFAEFIEFQAKFTQTKASVKVEEKVEADTKVLEAVAKVTEPALTVSTPVPDKKEETQKLCASFAEFMEKAGHSKIVEPKFKIVQ
jgi:hypothetical protein